MGGYIGARSGTISATVANVQDVTATDTTPEITLKNTTEEDIDGGREGTVTFKGERSGGEEVTLAQIEGSHHLTNDDNRGQLVFKTNNNQLGDNVTEAKMTIDSVGDVNVTSGAPSLTITNTTHEDTDGGREGKLKFQGEQSGGELSTLAEIQASHDGTADDEKGDLIFRTNDGSDGASPTERLRIESDGVIHAKSGNLEINSQSTASSGNIDELSFRKAHTSGVSSGEYDMAELKSFTSNGFAGGLDIFTGKSTGGGNYASSLTARFDENGKVMVGKTSDDNSVDGILLDPAGMVKTVRANSICAIHNRRSSEGDIVQFRKDDTTLATIGIKYTDNLMITSKAINAVGIEFTENGVVPTTNAPANSDDQHDLGSSGQRWRDIYAGNSTINTSDENEKQQITALTNAEITAAKALSKLFKTYKWNSAVEAKGDNARTHTGVIAQQVETAMSDAGLDAGDYAFFISNTWWETQTEVAAVEADEENDILAQDAYTEIRTYKTQEEAPEGATERTRMGIRYPELLSFIGAATEQRLTSIEARLAALEAE